MEKKWKEMEKEDLKGKVFVIPTDTIYGFSALAFDQEAKEKISAVKKMSQEKAMIHLIANVTDMSRFGVIITERQKKFLENNWPSKLSIIVKDIRGKKISFRIPDKKELIDFIKKVGPITSASFNISGEPYQKNLVKLKNV